MLNDEFAPKDYDEEDSCNRPLWARLYDLSAHDLADSNIYYKKMKLFLPGGMYKRKIYEKDKMFEVFYNIQYYSLGCVQREYEFYEDYNKAIFDVLDNKYGLAWRLTVREDTIGFKPKAKK